MNAKKLNKTNRFELVVGGGEGEREGGSPWRAIWKCLVALLKSRRCDFTQEDWQRLEYRRSAKFTNSRDWRF